MEGIIVFEDENNRYEFRHEDIIELHQEDTWSGEVRSDIQMRGGMYYVFLDNKLINSGQTYQEVNRLEDTQILGSSFSSTRTLSIDLNEYYSFSGDNDIKSSKSNTPRLDEVKLKMRGKK